MPWPGLHFRDQGGKENAQPRPPPGVPRGPPPWLGCPLLSSAGAQTPETAECHPPTPGISPSACQCLGVGGGVRTPAPASLLEHLCTAPPHESPASLHFRDAVSDSPPSPVPPPSQPSWAPPIPPPQPLLSLSTALASRQHRTWGGHKAGLEGARLSGHGGAGPLHGGTLLRARAGQGFRRPAAPLQRLVNSWRVSGQVGQLVEDAALPDDGVDQVGVACGRGGVGVSARPPRHPLHQSGFLGWEELGGQEGCLPQGEATAKSTEDGECGQGWCWGQGGGLRRLQDATCQQKSFWAELTPAPPWYPGDPLTTQHEGATPGKAGWAQHVRVLLSQLFNILTVPQARSPGGRTILNALGSEGDRSTFWGFSALPSRRSPRPGPLPTRQGPRPAPPHSYGHISPQRLRVDCAPPCFLLFLPHSSPDELVSVIQSCSTLL